jgi:hypothetical protein
MFRRTFYLLLATALVITACGTMSVSIEQEIEAPPGGTPDPTKMALELEATSMSAFVTQQAAQIFALTPSATPYVYDPSRPWKTYQDPTFGITMEYPAIYDEPPYSDSCGLKPGSEEVRLGRQIQVRFLYGGGLSLEEYTTKFLQENDWKAETQYYETVSGLPAITVFYRIAGTEKGGIVTLVEYNGLVYAFGLTEGDTCEIPGSPAAEDQAFTHMISTFRILTAPMPQASPTPYASPVKTYPILVFPPYNSRAGFLLGGSRNGQWLDPATTAASLNGEEAYAIYEGTSLLGYSVGSLPSQVPPFCPAMQEVSLHLDDPLSSVVALGTDWNALPRIPEEISTDNAIYRQVIGEFLVNNGIPQADNVRIDRVLKVDLEGDGVYEVLISASHFDDGSGHDVMTGDYSVVLLRKVSGNSVLTIPLAADTYTRSAPSSQPDRYLLTAVLDLNGDHKMEIVLGITGWEKAGALAYEVDGTAAREVLQMRCPE